ncbi:O-antigen polymerase, partial [Hippea sp. KM1]|uniref:O-antigen polymerase n=1 Tax=Hippea sp. KM1 TaxID=944481 RepID=UPI0005519723
MPFSLLLLEVSCLFFIYILSLNSKKDIFMPSNIELFFFSAAFGGMNFWLFVFEKEFNGKTYQYLALMVFIFAISYFIGYRITTNNFTILKISKTKTISNIKLKFIWFFSLLFAIGLFVVLLKLTHTNPMKHPLQFRLVSQHKYGPIALLMKTALFLSYGIALYFLFSKKRKLFFIISITIFFIFFIVSGARSNLLLMGVMYLLFYHYYVKRVSFMKIALYIGVMIPIFIGYTIYRTTGDMGKLIYLNGEDGYIMFEPIFRWSGLYNALVAIESYLNNHLDFKFLQYWTYVLTLPIPRMFWSGKPLDTSRDLSITFAQGG